MHMSAPPATGQSITVRGGWAAAGTLAQVACQVAAIAVLARILTPYEFGVVSAAALVTQLSLIFSEFGVGPYIVQREHLEPSVIGTCHAASCCLGFAITILLWIGAPLLAAALHVPELTAVLRAYTVVFLVTAASAVHDALLQRQLNFKYLAHADAVSFAVGYTAVSIGCALAGFSYWSIVVGHLSQAAIRSAMIMASQSWISRCAVSMAEVRPLLRFGAGQTLARLGAFVGGQADAFVVTARLGVVAIGFYGRANQLVTMPAAQLGQVFDKVIFPSIARMQEDRARAARAYCMAITAICLFSVPLSVLVWILGNQIVHLALGSQWDAVAPLMRILALAIPFRLIHKVSDPTARALGATYSRAWRQTLFALAVLVLSIVLSRFGLEAIAWGVVIASLLDAALMAWLCVRLTGLGTGNLLRAVLPGARAGGIAALLAGLGTLATHFWGASEAAAVVMAGAVSLCSLALVAHSYRAHVR